MKSLPSGARLEWAAATGLAAVTVALFGWLLQRHWPLVGFDFGYFLPRLLDVRLHQLTEGYGTIQWWTPSFGAGLPAFPNPQHTQFMPAQYLLPWVGPWVAAVAQACVGLAVGMLLLFHACRRLGCSLEASLLGAAAWGTAGFYWEHALVGHMGFNSFALVAVLPLALGREIGTGRSLALLSLTAASIIFSGGYTVILIFALTAGILVWLLPLWQPASYSICRSLSRLIGGGLLATIIAAAKVVAGARFLAEFPRLADYQFAGPTWSAPGALIAQLFGHSPLLLASRWLPFSRESIQSLLGGGEHVGFSPVIAVVLAGGLILAQRQPRFFSRGSRGVWLGLMFSLWFVAECALGRGLVWPLLKPLPFLRSLHENHRLTAAYLLPLCLLTAASWDLWRVRVTRLVGHALTAAAVLACLVSLEPYARARDDFWFSGFDASAIARTWDRLRSVPDERFVIDRVADIRDDAVFLAHASSWKPYEPIFGYGYGGAQFRPQTTPGPIRPDPLGATFNFTAIPTLLRDGAVETAVFTRLSRSEAPALDRLLSRHQPDWTQPLQQRVANWCSLLGVATALVCLIWPARRSPDICLVSGLPSTLTTR